MNGVFIALLVPFLGTMLGSAFVFFMRHEMSPRLQNVLLGFASGVMVAASVWSLLIPCMEMNAGAGKWSVLPAAGGFLLGIFFLLLIDTLTPHLHIDSAKPEGVRSHLSRTAMLSLAVTIHNFPEGMAVGVVIAGALEGSSYISQAGVLAMSLGIAIQNIPEGAIISMPMKAAGGSKLKSFAMGTLSGAVEPIGGLLVILLTSMLTPILPYMLSGTDTGSLARRAHQPLNHRLCRGLCAYDGARRGARLNPPASAPPPVGSFRRNSYIGERRVSTSEKMFRKTRKLHRT